MTQPKEYLHVGRDKKMITALDNPKRNIFDCLCIGDEFYFHDQKAVKITQSYFNIQKNVINAIMIDTGECIRVPSGLCVRYIE